MSSTIKVIYFFLLFMIPANVAGRVSVLAKIDSTEIRIGEQATLSIVVQHAKDQAVEFPTWKNEELVDGIEVIEASEIVNEQTSEWTVSTKEYCITSFSPNLYYIPPIHVKVEGKDYTTLQLTLKVVTVEVDTLHTDKFYGPKDIQELSYSWDDWKDIWVASLLLILLLLITMFNWKGYVPKPKPLLIKKKEDVLPHVWAMEKIRELKNSQKSNTVFDSKQYYSELIDILRFYIENRYQLSVMNMTSNELVACLIELLQENSEIHELKAILATADLVKYAKFKPQENEDYDNLVKIEKFIQTTKSDIAPLNIQPKESAPLPVSAFPMYRIYLIRIMLLLLIGIVSYYLISEIGELI